MKSNKWVSLFCLVGQFREAMNIEKEEKRGNGCEGSKEAFMEGKNKQQKSSSHNFTFLAVFFFIYIIFHL